MSRSDSSASLHDSPQTSCSNCQTVFEVSPELLSSVDTRVRCGECLSIFDALANLCYRGQVGESDAEAGNVDTDDAATALGGLMAPEQTEHGQPEQEQPISEPPVRAESSIDPATGDTPEAPHDANGFDDHAAESDSGNRVPTAAREIEDLDVTYADFDLFSGDAELPSVAYFDQTTEAPTFDFDAIEESDADETFSDTLFLHDVQLDSTDELDDELATDETGGSVRWADGAEDGELDVGILYDDSPRQTIDFRYQDSERHENVAGSDLARDDTTSFASPVWRPAPMPAQRSQSVRRYLSRALLILSCSLLIAGLYTWRERNELHNYPWVRPALIALCTVADCEVPERVDLASLKLLEREVYAHPDVEDALIIRLAFRNLAEFAQQHPVLVVRLSDRTGRVVARRDFAPREYRPDWDGARPLAAGERLDVRLEIGDPGDVARSLELDFRES